MLSGPTQVAPSSTNVYTLTIETARPRGGFNVRANTGTLFTGGEASANTRTIVGAGGRIEITHSGPKIAVDDVITFSFQWTAPERFTSASLVAWGNAVNFNDDLTGDRANDAILMITSSGESTATTSPTITETPLPTQTPSATATLSATPTTSSTATPTATASATPVFDDADANCDGLVTAADVAAFVTAFVVSATTDCDADVDGDGSLTPDDLDSLIEALYQR